jgi:hypothetical protein
MDADLRLELANATIAERRHQADREHLARLARTWQRAVEPRHAMAARSPRLTVSAAGA